jgi:hypothetical protein
MVISQNLLSFVISIKVHKFRADQIELTAGLRSYSLAYLKKGTPVDAWLLGSKAICRILLQNILQLNIVYFYASVNLKYIDQ